MAKAAKHATRKPVTPRPGVSGPHHLGCVYPPRILLTCRDLGPAFDRVIEAQAALRGTLKRHRVRGCDAIAAIMRASHVSMMDVLRVS
jgi:hypothetical protein